MASDGLQGVWQDIIQNADSISTAFDSIKNTWNELMLLIFYIYFFVTFLLFVAIALGLFIAFPIFLFKWYKNNKKDIDRILFFEVDFKSK